MTDLTDIVERVARAICCPSGICNFAHQGCISYQVEGVANLVLNDVLSPADHAVLLSEKAPGWKVVPVEPTEDTTK
jgi:hypothetical protein